MPYEIAFVDDTSIVRNLIAAEIEASNTNYKVIQYLHGKDFIERLPKENYQPKIVLMDISMPFMNGYDTTAWFKSKYQDIPVLAVSMLDNEIAMIRMYQKGANGFVSKNAPRATLFEAIDQVQLGNFYFNIGTQYKVIKNALYHNGEVIPTDKALTIQEENILKLIASDKSYQAIATELGISYRTLETHKRNIAEKLNLHSREGLMLYAIKIGLVHV